MRSLAGLDPPWLLLTVVTVAALAGCSRKSDAPVAAASASIAPAPPPAPSASPGAAGGLTATLADRLMREAQSRPPIHPNADEAMAAFASAGSEIGSKRQGLGATYKASFCEGGTTADGNVTVSVCEYPDDPATAAGLAATQAIFPAKQATHTAHKQLVLTTLRLKDGAAAQGVEKALIAAFGKL